MNRLIGVAVAIAVLLVGFGSLTLKVQNAPSPGPNPLAGIYFDQLVIVLLENMNLEEIYGPAPYMTQLADQYAISMHWESITNPSQPNYIALIGGDTFGVTDNGGSFDLPYPTIVDLIENSGQTWKAFAEDASGTGCNLNPPRGADHYPFLSYATITSVPSRCANLLSGSYNEVISAFNAGTNFVWLTPNDCNNMHSCSIQTGDDWLASWVPQLLTAMAGKKAALLITFDEGYNSPPLIYTSFSGPAVKLAYKSTASYTHYSFIKLLEDNWGGGSLGQGDVSAPSPTEFFVSATPPSGPVARFTVSPALPLINSPVTFDATTSSDSDPNATLQARWDWEGDGTWDTALSSNLIATHTFTIAGTYPTALQITDSNALSHTTTRQVTVQSTADTTPPVTTASAAGPNGNNNWYTGTVDVSLTATDGGSGVGTVHRQVDGGGYQTYTGPFPVSGDGSHTVDYYSTDNAGNNEATHSLSVDIDGTAPSTTRNLDGTLAGDGSYVAVVNVSLSASDATSGVQSIQYRIDGGSLRTYSGPFPVTGNGTHSVDYYATDRAGNDETAHVFSVRVSGSSFSGPVTTLASQGTLGENGWYASPVDVVLTATSDSGSAVTIEYRIDTGSWTTYSGAFTIDEGSHVVEYQASDAAGYVEAVRSGTFDVDWTRPSFESASPGGQVATPDVALSWSATDDVSGIARYEVSIDGGAFGSVGQDTQVAGRFSNGPHTVTVKAIDQAGNEAVVVIGFSVEDQPFDILNPVQWLPLYLAPAFALGLLLLAIALAFRSRGRHKRARRAPASWDDPPEL